MESNTNNSEDKLERDICEKIRRVMSDHDSSEVPVIDIVDGSSAHDDATSSSVCPQFSDELEDLLEEQMILKKIKKLKDYRRSLADYTDPELDKIDHRIQPKLKKSSENESVCEISKFDDCSGGSDNHNSDDLLIDSFLATDSRQFFERHNVKENLKKVSKALTLNVLMQSELTTLESFLMNRLRENRNEQINAKADVSKFKQIEGKTSKKKSKPVCWFTLFGRPYFKDEQKFTCPKNIDFKKMKQNNQIISSNLFPSRCWKIKERSHLEQGVKKILIDEQNEQFYEQEKQLQDTLKNDTNISAIKKREIKSELKKITNQIDKVKKKSLVELFSDCNPDREFDWLKISAQNVPQHSPEECQRMWHLYVKPTISKKKCTVEEDKNTVKLVEKYGEQNWDIIAKFLQTSRSEFLCFVNYQRRLSKGCRTVGKWTKEEDERLLSVIEKNRVGDYIPWPKVAYYFEERSLTQLYNRWIHSLNPNLKKGRFTKVEDKLIVTYIRKYGENFPKISKLLGYRTSTQIRERYSRKKPLISQNVGRWSLEEDELLLSLVKKYGVKRWSQISKQFITRTRTQIRQRYNAIKRFIIKYPDLGIADIHRGPIAKSQYLIPIKAEQTENSAQEEENKMLSDLIKEGKIKNDLLKQQEKLIMRTVKRGRRQISKRSKIDLQLIDYFREVFSNEKLKLRTDYVKPDITRAANALQLFSSYFKTAFNFSGNEFEKSLKELPYTLKKVVLKMIENGSKNGPDIASATDMVDITSKHQVYSTTFDTSDIDCLPVNPKETLVCEFDYLLTEPNEETELYESNFARKKSQNLNFIPFFLPPNIISMIGCRSIMLIKHKIINSMVQVNGRDDFFNPNASQLMKRNNLKVFNGYFSEDESESGLPKKRGRKKKVRSINNERELSNLLQAESSTLPAVSAPCFEEVNESSGSNTRANSLLPPHIINLNSVLEPPISQNSGETFVTSLPSTSTSDQSVFVVPENSKEEVPCKISSDKPVEHNDKSSQEMSFIMSKKLTKQEAVDLWKERLMALFGWPIVLANQPPNFSEQKKEDEKENNTNRIKLEPLQLESLNLNMGKPNFPIEIEVLTQPENKNRRYHSEKIQLYEEDEYDKKLKNYFLTIETPSHSNDGEHIPAKTDDSSEKELEKISIQDKRTSKRFKKSKNLSKITLEDNSISQNSKADCSINRNCISLKNKNKRQRKTSKLLEGFETY